MKRRSSILSPFLTALATLMGLTMAFTLIASIDPVVPIPWDGPVVGNATHGVGASTPRDVASAGLGIASSGDWWNRASGAIREMEYRPSQDGEGRIQAPNRAQGFRAHFRPHSVELTPRHPAQAVWSWTWTTVSLGREGEAGIAPPAALSAASGPDCEPARVVYRHPGITEWYVNSPDGLEQGFTIERAPSGEGHLRLTGRVGGDLRPGGFAPGGRAIEFRNAGGQGVLRYGKLAARDATGEALACTLDLIGSNEVHLVVDDHGARYPIEIDPLLDTPAWTEDGPFEGALFGTAVSTCGDVNGDGFSDIVIGAPTDVVLDLPGRAYVYYGSTTGLPADPGWEASDEAIDSQYASDATAAGDVNGDGYQDIAISAHWDERVYIYHGSPGGLGTEEATVLVNPGGEYVEFGVPVSGAGDVNGDGYDDLVVGCHNDYTRGGAWLYLGSSDGLESTPAWFTEGQQDSCNFGIETVGVGDVNADGYSDVAITSLHPSNTYRGRVDLFLGGPAGLGSTPAWTEEGEADGDRFGVGLAAAGDVNGDGYADVVIGAPLKNSSAGRVYIYRGCASGLEGEPAWTKDGDQAGSRFGENPATAGDVNGDGLADVLLGAHLYDGTIAVNGRAWVYYGSRATTLATDPVWWAEGDMGMGYFGAYLSTAGDVNGDGFSDILIGAALRQEWQGRVQMWLGSGDGPREAPGWVIESNQAQATFGQSIASAGDVNGDGYDDMLVGSPAFDSGQSNEGVAFLFLGHGAGPSVLPDWYAQSNQIDARLGQALAGAGDVNGDGYDDVLVGAPYYDGANADDGRAFLWLGTPTGSPNGDPTNAAWSGGNNLAGALYGWAVGGAGDVNADGFADVIVGSPGFSSGQTHEGGVGVYLGTEDGLSTGATWIGQSNQAEAYYGYSVAGAGDVNADGYCDVLVGAPYYDDPEAAEGIVRLYAGYAGGIVPTAVWAAGSNQADAHFGWSVATAGDVNSDGYSDLLIGAPNYLAVGARVGLACVWHGGSTGPSGSDPSGANFRGVGASAGDECGWWVSTAGDVNGDGYSDVAIGIPYGDDTGGGTTDAGCVWYIPGGPHGVEPMGTILYGAQMNGAFGAAIASADVNGDGFTDILVGAPAHDAGQVDEGRAFVYYGNESRGMGRAPDQMQSNLVVPVGLRGMVYSSSSFGARAVGRSAAGRSHVRLEWEVERTGLPFDGVGIGVGETRATGTPVEGIGSTVALADVVAGLSRETPYHWRVRIASTNPLFPRTPWFSPSGNAATETDFRTAGAIAEVSELSDQLPAAIRLDCAPNPFHSAATIRCALPARVVGGVGPAMGEDAAAVADADERVRLAVYDVQGRLVRDLIPDKRLPAGVHTIRWDGCRDDGAPAPAGVYWVRMTANGAPEVRRKIVRIE